MIQSTKLTPDASMFVINTIAVSDALAEKWPSTLFPHLRVVAFDLTATKDVQGAMTRAEALFARHNEQVVGTFCHKETKDAFGIQAALNRYLYFGQVVMVSVVTTSNVSVPQDDAEMILNRTPWVGAA